jgi:hypothetical protein
VRETKPSSSAQKHPSLLGLLGILAFFFGAWFFSKMSAPDDNSGKSIHPQDTPRTEGERGQASSGVLVAHSLADPENAKERRRRKTPWSERATVFIALALLIANWFQGCQTKKAAEASTTAADAARKSAESTASQVRDYEVSQAAHIIVHISQAKVTFVGKELHWIATCTVKNVGATTAKEVNVVPTSGGGRVLPPRDQEPSSNVPNANGPSIPFDATSDVPCIMGGQYQADQTSEIMAGRVFVYGCVEVFYKDVFGYTHIAGDSILFEYGHKRFDWGPFCHYDITQEKPK